MKSIDLFCASPASTAICTGAVDHKAIIRHGIRSIDRHIQRLGSETPRRAAPCSSHLPFDPSDHKSTKTADTLRRKSCADVNDRPAPPSSSTYLLCDAPFLDSTNPPVRDYNRPKPDGLTAYRSMSTRSYRSPVYSSSLVKVEKEKSNHRLNAIKSPSPQSNHQVVELRVSIHCKGCEGKLRKHISRMQGVTSFNIELETKKVTIIGDVTPLSVLTSISKVKNAQFWPSPSSSSSSSSLS